MIQHMKNKTKFPPHKAQILVAGTDDKYTNFKIFK